MPFIIEPEEKQKPLTVQKDSLHNMLELNNIDYKSIIKIVGLVVVFLVTIFLLFRYIKNSKIEQQIPGSNRISYASTIPTIKPDDGPYKIQVQEETIPHQEKEIYERLNPAQPKVKLPPKEEKDDDVPPSKDDEDKDETPAPSAPVAAPTPAAPAPAPAPVAVAPVVAVAPAVLVPVEPVKIVKAKPKKKEVKKEPAKPSGKYWVQVASMVDQDHAVAAYEFVKRRFSFVSRLPYRIHKSKVNKINKYLVQLGPFDSQKTADKVRSALFCGGQDAMLSR